LACLPPAFNLPATLGALACLQPALKAPPMPLNMPSACLEGAADTFGLPSTCLEGRVGELPPSPASPLPSISLSAFTLPLQCLHLPSHFTREAVGFINNNSE